MSQAESVVRIDFEESTEFTVSPAMMRFFETLALMSTSKLCNEYISRSGNERVLRFLLGNSNLDPAARRIAVERLGRDEVASDYTIYKVRERVSDFEYAKESGGLAGVLAFQRRKHGLICNSSYYAPNFMIPALTLFCIEAPKQLDEFGFDAWSTLFSMVDGWSSDLFELPGVVAALFAEGCR